MRMHMDPEFWYQQHDFDSDTHHLSNHMIDMVQKYMRGDATRMETYIDLGVVAYEFKHSKGIFACRKFTMEGIRSACWVLRFAWQYMLQCICKLFEQDQNTGRRSHYQWLLAIIADHLTYFELGGDGHPMHQLESPPHVWAESVVSRVGRWAGGGYRDLRRCDYQIEHQPSHSGRVFERDKRPMWEWQAYQPNW